MLNQAGEVQAQSWNMLDYRARQQPRSNNDDDTIESRESRVSFPTLVRRWRTLIFFSCEASWKSDDG